MAYEKINQFTQILKDRYIELGSKILKEENKEERLQLYAKQKQCFDSMLDYEQTVLQMPKFKSQKLFMRTAIVEINPHFAKGYYKL